MAAPGPRPPVLASRVHLEAAAAEAAAAAAARKVTAERLLQTAPTAPAIVAAAPAGPVSAAGAAAPDLSTGSGEMPLAALQGSGGAAASAQGGWAQQLLDLLWPYARDAAQRKAWDTIPPMLEASRPPWVSRA